MILPGVTAVFHVVLMALLQASSAEEGANPSALQEEPAPLREQEDSGVPQEARRARAEILLAQCQAAWEKGDFSTAADRCAESLREDASLVPARVLLARAKWELGNREEAVTDMEEAAAQLPDDARLLGQLGLWQLELDNVVWAARNLRRALELAPGDDIVRLACIAAFLRNREWRGAMELASPLLESPDADIRSRAHWLAGMAAVKQGERARARAHFRKARAGSAGRQAELQLKSLTRMERGWERGLSFGFSLGLGMDTNPAYSQELDTVRARTTAGHMTQPLRLSWVPREDVKLEGALASHYFFAPWGGETHEQVIAFSSLGAEASLAGRWFLSTWPVPAHLEGQAFWSAIGLLGGEGIPDEPEPFAFMERAGASLELALQRVPGREAAVGMTGARVVYRDLDRDGFSGTLFVRHSWFLRRDALKIFTQAFAGGQQARWAAWSFWNAGLWLGASVLLPDRFELALAASLECRWYPESGEEAGAGQNPWNLAAGEDRWDLGGFASGVLSRPLGRSRNWRWEVVVRHQFVESVAEAFSFSRWSLLLQLSGDVSRR